MCLNLKPCDDRRCLAVTPQALIRDRTSFPAGPIELPTTAQPRLLLEWSMSVRLLLQDPDDLTPKKMPIVRQFLPGDRSGYSCWGWYSQVRESFQAPFCTKKRDLRPYTHAYRIVDVLLKKQDPSYALSTLC